MQITWYEPSLKFVGTIIVDLMAQNMTRFKSKDDQGFIRVSGELDRWLHALRSDDEGAQERRQAQEERTQAQEG